MAKSLLLLSQRPDDEIFTQIVAETAGLEYKRAQAAPEAVEIIAGGEVATIFVDLVDQSSYAAFDSAIQQKMGSFSDLVNGNRTHYISTTDLQDVSYLFKSPIFGHYIRRNYGDIDKVARRYGKIVKATLNDRAFGLETLMRDGSRIQVVKFQSTKQKQEGVEAVKNYLLAAKFKTRMATVIANAVDELIMNAMFDAPIDELGKPLHQATPRDSVLPIAPDRPVEMHVGYDGDYVAITAVDGWGSLDKVKLFSHIAKRYNDEEYKVKTAVAGAGIGLATVFRSGGSFLFASESRVRTEVTVFFQRTDNFREFKDQFRFISSQFYF